jgi:hypothetical protein
VVGCLERHETVQNIFAEQRRRTASERLNGRFITQTLEKRLCGDVVRREAQRLLDKRSCVASLARVDEQARGGGEERGAAHRLRLGDFGHVQLADRVAGVAEHRPVDVTAQPLFELLVIHRERLVERSFGRLPRLQEREKLRERRAIGLRHEVVNDGPGFGVVDGDAIRLRVGPVVHREKSRSGMSGCARSRRMWSGIARPISTVSSLEVNVE